jgi:hypothetical protein
MNNVIIMKNKMKRNKELYDNEFNKLIDIKPKIYSMANDCYRCTWDGSREPLSETVLDLL